MRVGLPELFLLVALVPLLVFGVIGRYALTTRGRARQFGYSSARAYLRAAPRSDAEKRDAVDLLMRGVVVCLLGLLFKPFVLLGLIPLFYGGRKLAYAMMGLGLVDDPEQPGA